MDRKLKDLRSSMDDTIFKDGEWTETDKNGVRKKIEKHQRRRPWFNIFHKKSSWPKAVLGAAVCLFLVLGTVFIVNHNKPADNSAAADFPYPEILSKEEGKFSILYISKNKKHPGLPFVFSHGLKEKTVSKIRHKSFQEAKTNYSKLDIKKVPVYIFLDTKGIVFRTNDWRKTGQFLNDYLKQTTEFPYPSLLSGRKGKLTFLYVTSGVNPKFMQETYWGKVATGGKLMPLSSVKESYPELNITESPYYIFFDTEGVVFRTSSEQKAEQFVRGQFQFDKFEKVLERAGISSKSIIWVQTHASNRNDQDRVGFIVFRSENNRVAVGKLQKQNGTWQWVEGSGHKLKPQEGFHYQELVLNKSLRFVYGVASPDISEVIINGNDVKTIELGSGRTFWYKKVTTLDEISAYGKGGSVIYSESNISGETTADDEQNSKDFTAFYQNNKLSDFTDFHLSQSQAEQIRHKLAAMGADHIGNMPFIPSEVPKGTKLVDIEKVQQAPYSPEGPFLVLQFNTFKIYVTAHQPEGSFIDKRERIEITGINHEKAGWFKRISNGLTFYDLSIFGNKVVTISSPLEKVSYKDLEKTADSFIRLE